MVSERAVCYGCQVGKEAHISILEPSLERQRLISEMALRGHIISAHTSTIAAADPPDVVACDMQLDSPCCRV